MNRSVIHIFGLALCLTASLYPAQNPQKEVMNAKNQLLQNEEINKDPQASAIARSLISIHTRVFGINNLLTQWGKPKKKKEDIAQWDKLLDQVQEYLNKNNSSILPELQKISLISKQLIVELSTIYSNYVMPALPLSKRDGGFDLTDLNNIDMTANLKPDVLKGLHDALAQIKLNAIQTRVNSLSLAEIDRVMNTLDLKIKEYRASRAIGSRQKRIATQILYYFGDIVKTTMQKIKNDTIRLARTHDEEIAQSKNSTDKKPVAPPKLPAAVDRSAIYLIEKKAWKDDTRWPGHVGLYYPANDSWYFEGRGWWSDTHNGWWDTTTQKWVTDQQPPVPPRFGFEE